MLRLERLAFKKVSSLVPFMMPERMAKTGPHQQNTDTLGSGPFKFVREEFEPGHKVVYVKNPDYMPRSEPPDWASGGKVIKVDRVEWIVVPEPSTAAATLGAATSIGGRTHPQTWFGVLAANAELAVEDPEPRSLLCCLAQSCFKNSITAC